MITKIDYIPETKISMDSYEDAVELARILLKNGYAVLLSTEGDLTIINYIAVDCIQLGGDPFECIERVER